MTSTPNTVTLNGRSGRNGKRFGPSVPLRLRLAAIYGALASLALTLALIGGYGFYERGAFRSLDLSLRLVQMVARPSLERPESFQRLEPPQIGLPLALREYDQNGRLLRSSGELSANTIGSQGSEPDPIAVLGRGTPAHAAWIELLPFVSSTLADYAGLGLTVVGGERWRSFDARLPDGRIVRVLMPLGRTDAALATVRVWFAALGLIGVVLVFGLGYALSGPSLRPLSRLVRAARGVVNNPRVVSRGREFDPDLTPLEEALDATFARLSEREQFISGVLGATPSLVYVYDLELNANTYSNDQLGPLLGYTHDQIRGFDGDFVERLIHPDNRDLTWAHLNGVRDSASGAVLENEYRVRHADGSWRWFRSRDVVFERGPNGQPRSILGVADDVTERRQTEANARFLLDLDGAIRAAIGPIELEQTATRLIGEHLAADRVLFAEIDGETVRFTQGWSPVGASVAGEFSREHYFSAELTAIYAAGGVRVVEDATTDATTLEHAPALAALGIVALVNVPVFSQDGWAGILSVHRSAPHRWSPGEVGLIRDVAARVWPQIERTRATLELIQTTVELAESRARLDAALESSRTGTWELDVATEEIVYSGAFGPFHGLPSGSGRVAAATIRTLAVPEDAARNRPAFEHAIKTGGMFEAEYRVRVEGRSEIWLLSRGRVVGEEDGHSVIAGTVTDITERRRSENALRRNEARYRALVEAGAQVVWRADADGILLEEVKRWSALTGAPPETLELPTVLEAWVHPDDLESGSRRWREATTSGSQTDFEQRVRQAGGGYRFWAVRTAPVRDETGRILEWIGTDTDVTERRLAERAVLEGEARYRTLFESIDQGFCICELIFAANEPNEPNEPGKPIDLRYLEVNPAFERQSGLRGATGQTLRELGPAFGEDWLETFAQVVQSGESATLVGRAEALDRWFEIYACRIGGEDSPRFAILFSDISERVRGETQLRRLAEITQVLAAALTPEQVRRTILERVVWAAGATGGSLRFKTDNGAALLLRAQLDGEGMNPAATLAAELVPLGAGHPASEAARTGRPVFVSDAAALTDRYPELLGALQHATQACAHLPLVGEDRVLGVLSLNFAASRRWETAERDFLETLADRAGLALERTILFERLSRSEAQYRALVQSTSQFVWRRSGTGGEDPESTAWWSDLTGQTPDEAAGLGWLAALHPDDRERARAAWTEAFAAASVFSTDYRVRSKSGRYLHLEVRGVPIFGPDAAPDWVGTFVDVTGEREAVERIRELNEAQHRFVSDASHELRAPLTSIQGNLDLLIRYPDMSPEDRVEAVGDARSEARRMARLVANLLAAARGEAGIERDEPVALEVALGTAWRVAGGLSNRHHFDLGPLEPIVVRGDADQIQQLALILLENAVKYTPDGGAVRLSSRTLDGHAEFTVSDTGRGIATEDAAHVFKRFYRADLARTPGSDPGGSGLGLTIAHKIAENHGGSISLESAPGIGSSFIVRLPLAVED